MTFAEYTKKRKEQNKESNKNGGVQETVPSPAKEEKPKSFAEYTRKKKGVTAWRDEEQGGTVQNSNKTPATKVSYGMTKAEYDMRRSSNPSLPEYGSHEYYKNREETLRPIMKEISEDWERRDSFHRDLAKKYEDGLLPKDVDEYTMEMGIRLSKKFKYQDSIIAEYKEISDMLDSYEKGGIHYNEQGMPDSASGKPEAEYRDKRYSAYAGANALTQEEIRQGSLGMLPEAKQSEFDGIKQYVDNASTEYYKGKFYDYYDKTRKSKFGKDSQNSEYWDKRYQEEFEKAKAEGALNPTSQAIAIVDAERKQQATTYTDDFWGQSASYFKATDIGMKKGAARGRYVQNPTDDNLALAEAWTRFSNDFQNQHKTALDDEGVVAPWFSRTAAGYLAQEADRLPAKIAGGAVGFLVGGKYGMAVGSGLATSAHMFTQLQGQAYEALIEAGVDDETARKYATDEAFVSSLIEGGDAALDVLLLGGGTTVNAIKNAAKSSIAKGSTNKITKLIAKKAIAKAAKSASKPLWKKAVNLGVRIGANAVQEYVEEFSQGAVTIANKERALATADKEIGQFGKGNIDLHNRPVYKNEDGTISTVDSVIFIIDDKYVVLPTIARDKNGNAIRLNTDEEIINHFMETGEYLGEFDTEEESVAYSKKLHAAQAYYYSQNNGVNAGESLVSGGAKVIGSAISGNNPDAFAELHEQGAEGFKIGLMFGGSQAIVNNIVTQYANAKTIKNQNEILDTIINDEDSLDALIEDGKSSGEGTVAEKLATKIEATRDNGKKVTREQVKRLLEANDVYAREEEQISAPDSLEQAAMDVVASRNASQEEKTFETYRMNSVLGDSKRSIGIAGGQAFVTNSTDINPSPTNRSVFLPVKDAEAAKTEFGATESNKASANISKLLNPESYNPIRKGFVDGTLKGVGDVRVYTDENGREIALERNVAEYFEGYNLEATFRGGKPYAIKATDNDGNVAGVAMAVWKNDGERPYSLVEDNVKTTNNVPFNVMSNENPILQERNAREAYIKKSTGYGQYGVKAFADIMETLPESEARSVAKSFRTAYEAGLTNLDTAQATLPTEVHRIAFNAGKQDYIMENVSKVENVKNVKSHGDKAGFDSTNVPSNVSKQAIDIFDRFCKELGVTARMTGNSDMYNANITPNVGVVRIARNFSIMEHLGNDAASLSFVTHGLHEVADHRAEELAPTEYAEFKREMYNYQNSLRGGSVADTQRQKYGNKGVDISLSEAMSEVTANSILELYDNDLNLLAEGLDRVLNGTNEKAKQGANIFKQALDYVIEKFNKFLEKLGVKTKETYKPISDDLLRIRDAFENTLRAAIVKNKEIAKSSNLVTEKNGTIVDAKGNVVAQINEDGTASFSLKTFDDSGRAELKKWLDKNVKNKKLTEAEAKDISEQLEYYYDICKEYEDKYAPFSAWSKAEVVKGLDGKPLMSVVKANGDYKMNLDFSLVCKKRRPLDALYRAMIDDGFMDDIGQLSEVEVARINEIIRNNGFETACTLCFVDSKRYRQYAVADAFVSKYNELVKMLAPEGTKIDRFDFSGKREASADGLHTMSNADLKSGINKLNKVIKEHGESTVVGKIANHLKAVPQDRKLVMVSDFMDSEGFVRVKKANPNVFKLYNSSKGSGGPKATLPDVQYLGEILKRSNFTPKKAYAVGGVRVQSFSDYIPRLVFDYLQMTADLSAKKLPAHAYSKEDIFVMQFGKTGIKINMSLVPAVAKDGIAAGLDKDGNYVWVDGHTFASDFHDKGSGQRGFELAVKIQNTEGYSQNCGTIAVGVSDEHIIKMLKDNDIRMVIPYHKSSLNHFVAQMGNIDQYKDYTNVQNTRDKATGKKIEGKDFNFNEAFHRLGDAKAATNEYLAWCEKNNYLPKFDTFAFHEDAEVRENYYKVLIDFAAYDSDGNSIPQGAVTMNFPTENDAFGSMKSLIEKGLEADAILEGRKTENIPKILTEVKSVLGETKASEHQEDVKPKYSLRQEFASEIDLWDGVTNTIFRTGATSEALKSIGVQDRQIIWHGKKIAEILRKHKNMSREVIKQVPQIMEHPVIVMKSQNTNSRITMFGEVKDAEGKPVLAVLELQPTNKGGELLDMNVVASAYGKDSNPAEFIKNSELLYLDPNKKRTNEWLNAVGLQLPSVALTHLGSIGSITYIEGNVNIKGIPYAQFVKTEGDFSLKDSEGNALTKEQAEYFEDSKVRDENGNLLVVYHGTSKGGFTVFDTYAYYSKFGLFGNGAYFTDNKDIAEQYTRKGKGQSPQVYSAYLNITNPIDMDAKANIEAWNKALQKTGEDFEFLKGEITNEQAFKSMVEDLEYAEVYSYDAAEIVRNVFEYMGYDGITHIGGGRVNRSDGTKHRVFIAFEQEQIKDITNTNPTTSPDINFSLKGTERNIPLRDIPKVRKAVADKNVDVLAKYVESGAMSTELYNQLIEEFGAIPKGEKPYRDVSVPSKTAEDKKVSQTVRTILEAEVTPDEAVPTIEKMVEDGVFSYDAYTDKQAIADSEAYIKEYGWDESLDDWFDAVNKGEVSKELTTMGWALYNNAANLAATTTSETERTSAIKTSLKILDAMVRHQRSAAQALQATRILKKLSPETQLYGIQKSVSAFQNELTEKYGKKAPDLKIDEDLAEQFINAKTEEERAAIEEEIYKDIGRQMPSDWLDKWNAWRYLAMLGNPRTHVRNFFGNMFFAPVVATKNLTATAIESAVYRVSGKKTVRGKALITGSKADRALLKAAWGDYSNVTDMISNGGKYNDSAMANQQIEEGRRIFKFKPLEWARKGNSRLLELEDMWFAQPHYAYALAQYCKAHNITAEQIQRGKAIAPAREYAIKEAQKATYRDTNALSQFVSGLGRSGKSKQTWVEKAVRTVIEGVLPFRKTPANILVRGLEYSPLGLLKGLADLRKVGKEVDGRVFTASEAIDNISAGLTGTGLLILGVYLAAQGLIRGHGEDDEEEREFKELMGHQSYSLELPNGQSTTLDWLAPEALPFFVGVNLWEASRGTDEDVTLSSILGAVSNISDPMLEMSFLQGINDVFESVGYAKSNDTSAAVAVLSSAVTSYLTQGIPTLFGQAERTTEEQRMTTYTEKNSFLTGDMQYTLGKASAKIPFWDYNQIPYIDAWGRQEASGTALKRGFNNFLNPAYTSTVESSSMEKELLRIYEQTGEGGVFPERADKYFTVDGVRKDLTADEYVRYATLKGENSYKMVSDLVNSKEYKKLSDEEKVKAIKDAYDYANQKAKKAISNYKPEKWVNTADEFGEDAENFIFFRTNVSATKEANGDKISKEQVVDIISDTAQNDSEAWNMYFSMYDSKTATEAEKHGIDAKLFMTAVVDMGGIKADYKENGKVVSGSRRTKIERYLNSVCNSYKEYLFLLGTEYDSVKDDYDYVQYFGKE